MSGLGEEDLRIELAAIEHEIRERCAALARLQGRREWIRDVLVGPRVIPTLGVWRHYSYDEEDVDSVEDGLSRAEGILDSETGAPVAVFVGGAAIPLDGRWRSDDEREDVMRAHREYEAEQNATNEPR